MEPVANDVNWNSRARAILDTARFVELLNYCTFAYLLSFFGIEEAALIVHDEVQASLDLWHSFQTAPPKSILLISTSRLVYRNAIRVHSNTFRP